VEELAQLRVPVWFVQGTLFSVQPVTDRAVYDGPGFPVQPVTDQDMTESKVSCLSSDRPGHDVFQNSLFSQ